MTSPSTNSGNKSILAYSNGFSKRTFGSSDSIGFIEDLVKKAKNGVLVIADAGPFFHLNKTDKLIEHELSIPSKFDVT
jgi:hypothetical protein